MLTVSCHASETHHNHPSHPTVSSYQESHFALKGEVSLSSNFIHLVSPLDFTQNVMGVVSYQHMVRLFKTRIPIELNNTVRWLAMGNSLQVTADEIAERLEVILSQFPYSNNDLSPLSIYKAHLDDYLTDRETNMESPTHHTYAALQKKAQVPRHLLSRITPDRSPLPLTPQDHLDDAPEPVDAAVSSNHSRHNRRQLDLGSFILATSAVATSAVALGG